MSVDLEKAVATALGAKQVRLVETLQTLWSGYGSIRRFEVLDGRLASVIVKHVQLPEQVQHPRGWHSSFAHQRKVRSYQIESAWYAHYAQDLGQESRVAKCFHLESTEREFLIVLEDLDAAGFSRRLEQARYDNIRACIQWLAEFHAFFLGHAPEHLWPTGTYWHLDTRPEELESLADEALKSGAHAIDQALKEVPYQTLVHGDAKLANFCFTEDCAEVAAVDFQYVGAGCGMKDLAYFVGSCFEERDCARYEQRILDDYFSFLAQALERMGSGYAPVLVEQAWRPMFAVAWADFHRFVKGWSPGHWKINSYSERLARQVLARYSSQGKVDEAK